MPSSRYVVGIDLGTTNSGAAFADTGIGEEGEVSLAHVPVPQLVQPATVEERPLLPPFSICRGPMSFLREVFACPGIPTATLPLANSPESKGARFPRD